LAIFSNVTDLMKHLRPHPGQVVENRRKKREGKKIVM
jgi:hypothetical protein